MQVVACTRAVPRANQEKGGLGEGDGGHEKLALR